MLAEVGSLGTVEHGLSGICRLTGCGVCIVRSGSVVVMYERVTDGIILSKREGRETHRGQRDRADTRKNVEIWLAYYLRIFFL